MTLIPPIVNLAPLLMALALSVIEELMLQERVNCLVKTMRYMKLLGLLNGR
jgi:hypothetical protein